jgi:hypothetical protein
MGARQWHSGAVFQVMAENTDRRSLSFLDMALLLYCFYGGDGRNASHGLRACGAVGDCGDYRAYACGSARGLAGLDYRLAGERPVGDEDYGTERIRTVLYAGRLGRRA